MPKDSRVIDCINKAGGLTKIADTTVINLSKKIKDEMVIIIYSKEEVAHFKETKRIENEVQKECIKGSNNALTNDACITPSDTKNATISINTSSQEELASLPGIGESKAKQIIDYRKAHGNFKVIEDIKNVPGIGDSVFAKIKDHITI